MTIKQAISILKKHQKWRMGADIPQIEPSIISEAINKIIEHYESIQSNKSRPNL